MNPTREFPRKPSQRGELLRSMALIPFHVWYLKIQSQEITLFLDVSPHRRPTQSFEAAVMQGLRYSQAATNVDTT